MKIISGLLIITRISLISLAILFSLTGCKEKKKLSLKHPGKMAPSVTKPTDTTLPYWTPDMSKTGNGYIDTFSVAHHQFRIVHHDTLHDGILEKLKNKKWLTVAQFVQIGNHNSYERNTDVNNDGYADVISTFKWDEQVFLYNPAIQSFINPPLTNFSKEWVLLNKEKKIYCCRQETKWATGYSDLYQFRGMKKIILFRIAFIEKKEDKLELDKVILYRVNNNNTAQLIKVKQLQLASEGVWDFKYEAYWRTHYKQLLHM